MNNRLVTRLLATTGLCGAVLSASAQPVYLTNSTQLMIPAGTNDNAWYGTTVSLSQDGCTALVTAPREHTVVGEWAGGAYVYSLEAGTWHPQAHLTADPGATPGRFGWSGSLSADGNIALVGDDGDSTVAWPASGAAHVFVRDGTNWMRETKLLALDGAGFDYFGWSVALSDDGTRALVGSVYHATMGLNNSGAAYVYARSNGMWTLEDKLTATDGAADAFFGSAVSLNQDGTIALVGAYNTHAAYVFTRTGTNWSQHVKLSPPPTGGHFGYWVSLDAMGRIAVVCAPDLDSSYVFMNEGGQWSQIAELAGFGYNVSLSRNGELALVGASDRSNSNGIPSGIAGLFHGVGTNWNPVATLAAADGAANDQFGWAVGLAGDGSTAIVGAFSDDTPTGTAAGSTHVFPLARTLSPEVTALQAAPGSPVHIEFSGGARCAYDILVTTNLTDWGLSGSTVADTNGWFWHDDDDAATTPLRFYRAQLQ